MGKIDVSIMSDKEREIYLRRVLMESAIFDEQIEQARINGTELVYGENYGMISLKELINMHPEYSKYVDQSVWDKSPDETGLFGAPFGEDRLIAINDGRIDGRREDGKFIPSDQLIDEVLKVPMHQMLLLTHSGIANEEYLQRYKDSFGRENIKANRIPDSFEEYLQMASSGKLMVTEEEFYNTIELTEEDRARLEEYKKEIGEEELGELDEEELEEDRERVRVEDEEQDGEEREEEERDAEEKTEEKIAEESVEKDSLIEDIKNYKENYKDFDMNKIREERAKILAMSVISRFNIPAASQGQLVKIFVANPDLDINRLKQAMEVTIGNKRGISLRFASGDLSLDDRMFSSTGETQIDERQYDSEISAKMDQEYAKAPVEILNKEKQVLVYTDYSGNTITAPLKKKNMNELTRSEGEKVIREFEELLSKERALIANRSSMTPANFSREMTMLSTLRLKVIGANGLNVPVIHDEIKADREISETIEGKIKAREEEEEKNTKNPELENGKEEEKDEQDDWVRGPYDPRHGM